MFLSTRTAFIDFNSRPWWAVFFQRSHIQVLIERQHGVVTIGKTVGECFTLFYQLENGSDLILKYHSAKKTDSVQLPKSYIVNTVAQQIANPPPGYYEWPALLRLAKKIMPKDTCTSTY